MDEDTVEERKQDYSICVTNMMSTGSQIPILSNGVNEVKYMSTLPNRVFNHFPPTLQEYILTFHTVYVCK